MLHECWEVEVTNRASYGSNYDASAHVMGSIISWNLKKRWRIGKKGGQAIKGGTES